MNTALRIVPHWGIVVALSLVLAAAGCDSSDDAVPDGTLAITAALDALPAQVGRNTMTVQLRDGDDLPVGGASLVVMPEMPAHGHGSTEEPIVVDQGAGIYAVSQVTFTMPGAWVVQINATGPGGATGSYSLAVDVE